MDREAIQQIIPHRDKMLLIDDVTEVDGEAIGHYQVRGDEFFLQGHFPGNPIVPGVILCEIMAQSACVLLAGSLPPGTLPLYTGLDKVRFKSPVRPGDTIETRCRLTRSKGPFHFATGTVSVEDRLCVSADFSFAVSEV